MHALLRVAQAGASLRCRRGRYDQVSARSSALRCIHLDRRSRRAALFSTLLGI